jgi:hypothetical protein
MAKRSAAMRAGGTVNPGAPGLAVVRLDDRLS